MSDWADEKAREWLDKYDPDIWHHRYSLAALLREVDGMARSETLVKCCIHDTVAPEPDCDCVICHRQRVLVEARIGLAGYNELKILARAGTPWIDYEAVLKSMPEVGE